MNEEVSEKYFMQLINEFGGWPILVFNGSSRLSSAEILKKLQEYDNEILFKFEIDQDPNNATKKMLKVIYLLLLYKLYMNLKIILS
jgi:hypothetical protein